MVTNPLKLLGSWIGFCLGIIVLYAFLKFSALVFGPIKMFSCNGNIPGDCLRLTIWFICIIISGFFLGWALHLLIRYSKKRKRGSRNSLVNLLIFVIAFLLFTISQVGLARAISNPAAVYCNELGYKYKIDNTADGQVGFCVINETVSFNAWDFYAGLVGKNYSYCSRQGLETVTLTDGNNPYSPIYAACKLQKVSASPLQSRATLSSDNTQTSNNTEIVSVSDLMNLREKVKTDTMPDLQASIVQNGPSKSLVSSTVTSTTVPSSFDWRNKNGHNWLTPAKDQGVCGSCWAFAAVGAVEANIKIWKNTPNTNPDLSEEYLVSDCSNAGTCQGGQPSGALGFIRDSGIPDENCMEYVDGGWLGIGGCPSSSAGCSSSCKYHSGGACSDATCSDRCTDWQSRLVKIGEFGASNPNNEDIKRALIEKGPLVAIMSPSGSWWGDNVYRCGSNKLEEWHVIDIVGYDDPGGYWIVKNSWGWFFDWLSMGSKVGYGECGIGTSGVYWVAVDTDGDKISDYEDACPSQFGTYCNGCPAPPCQAYLYCPEKGLPECRSCADPTQMDWQIRSDTVLCPGTYTIGPLGIYKDNINLDCNGATLVGSGSNDGIQVGDAKNVVIENCNLKNFYWGIYAEHLNQSTIRNNQIYQNKIGMLNLYGTENSITNNNFHDNTRALDIAYSNSNLIYQNQFGQSTGKYNQTLWIYGSKNNKIYGNEFYYQGIRDTNFSLNIYCVNNEGNNYYSGANGPRCNCVSNWVLSSTWSPCDITNTSYSDWIDINSCNQTIRRYKADCDYCQPTLTNSSWTAWRNQTKCQKNDTLVQNQSKKEFDSNYGNCYAVTKFSSDLWNNGKNKTYWKYNLSKCDYCKPNLVNLTWTAWINQTRCRINDTVLQNGSRKEFDGNYATCYSITKLPTDLWNNGKNKTYWRFWTTSCNYCSPLPVNTSWSAWQYQCTVNDTNISFTSRKQYDTNYQTCYKITKLASDLYNSGQNRTFWLYKTTACDYCTPQMVNSSWSAWSNPSCSAQNQVTRTRTRTFFDKNNCFAITKLSSDYRQNQTVTQTNTTVCSYIVIRSPSNRVYNTTRILFDISSKLGKGRLDYIDLSAARPSWITLCTSCANYSGKKTLSDGNHQLTFRSKVGARNSSSSTELFIDSQAPRISATGPRSKSFTSGSGFFVRYTELNVKNVTLRLLTQCGKSFCPLNSIYKDCPKGTNQQCSYTVNLSKFNNQILGYSFEITDIANNKLASRILTIKIDTNPPQITHFNYTVKGREITFSLNITEVNFDSVAYIDYSDVRPTWINLCTSLRNGLCVNKRTFRSGPHNIVLRVLDKAGNSNQESLHVTV